MNFIPAESLHKTLVGLQEQLDAVAGDPGDRETILKNWESGATAIREVAVKLEREAMEAIRAGAPNPDFWMFEMSAAAVAYGVAYALEYIAAADHEHEAATLLILCGSALSGLGHGAKHAAAEFGKEVTPWH